jgi:hypothetical protein
MNFGNNKDDSRHLHKVHVSDIEVTHRQICYGLFRRYSNL